MTVVAYPNNPGYFRLMTLKIPGHSSLGELIGPSRWSDFTAVLRSPIAAQEIASSLQDDFYTPEPVRQTWKSTDPALYLEIAGTHLSFLRTRSIETMRNVLSKISTEIDNSFAKTLDLIVRGHGDVTNEVSRFKDEIQYRMDVQLFARRGCRFRGSEHRSPLGIRHTMELAEFVRKECVLASYYLDAVSRLAAAERIAKTRGEEPLKGVKRQFSARDAATLSVLAQGRCPFSIDEDRHLLNLAEKHQDRSSRIVWSAVAAGMHEVFPSRKRSVAVYQQRLYKLCSS